MKISVEEEEVVSKHYEKPNWDQYQIQVLLFQTHNYLPSHSDIITIEEKFKPLSFYYFIYFCVCSFQKEGQLLVNFFCLRYSSTFLLIAMYVMTTCNFFFNIHIINFQFNYLNSRVKLDDNFC